MKEYEVEITTEVTYTVKVEAEDEDDAADQARYAFTGPCTIMLDDSDESYDGFIHEVWSAEDVHVVEEE